MRLLIGKGVWKCLKRILFLIDPEKAHWLTGRLIQLGSILDGIPLKIISGSDLDKKCGKTFEFEALQLQFRSPVGLAAGFDKNGEFLDALPNLGFGFAEIGTVTPRPQFGNLPPRLFRNPQNLALFNRMGFNNLGATVVANRLMKTSEKLPEWFRVGVNVGKNKDTPLDESRKDYVAAASAFENLCDYLVVNVSSPNTQGLRSLQTVDSLKPIVSDLFNLVAGWKKKPPILLKIAPEIKGDELIQLVQSMDELGIGGWVLTNTLAGSLRVQKNQAEVSGGWSGRPLAEGSRQSLIQVRQVTQKPIVSVGGILSVEDALDRWKAGANLIQIYTGWIYRGPTFPMEILQGISKCQNATE